MVNNLNLFVQETIQYGLNGTLEGARDIDLKNYEVSPEMDYPMQGGNIQLSQILIVGKDKDDKDFAITARYYKMMGKYYLMLSADLEYPENADKNKNFTY